MARGNVSKWAELVPQNAPMAVEEVQEIIQEPVYQQPIQQQPVEHQIVQQQMVVNNPNPMYLDVQTPSQLSPIYQPFVVVPYSTMNRAVLMQSSPRVQQYSPVNQESSTKGKKKRNKKR